MCMLSADSLAACHIHIYLDKIEREGIREMKFTELIRNISSDTNARILCSVTDHDADYTHKPSWYNVQNDSSVNSCMAKRIAEILRIY